MEVAKFFGIYIPPQQRQRSLIERPNALKNSKIQSVFKVQPSFKPLPNKFSIISDRDKYYTPSIYSRDKLVIGQNLIPPHYVVFGFFAFLVTAGVISRVYEKFDA